MWSGDGLNIFARRRLSRHFSHDLLFPEKFSRAFSHLQLEQSRKSPFLHVNVQSFVSTFRRVLYNRARSALFFKQFEHVFRLGLRFAFSTKRLHVEQKNIGLCAHARTSAMKRKSTMHDALHKCASWSTLRRPARMSRTAPRRAARTLRLGDLPCCNCNVVL
jgi:hypothetical protein